MVSNPPTEVTVLTDDILPQTAQGGKSRRSVPIALVSPALRPALADPSLRSGGALKSLCENSFVLSFRGAAGDEESRSALENTQSGIRRFARNDIPKKVRTQTR